MLPVSLLLLDYWPLRRLSREAVMEKVPLALLSAAALMAAPQAALAPRIENAVLACAMNSWRLLVPVGLAVTDPTAAPPLWQTGIAAVAICAATLAVVRAGPSLAMGWLWYVTASLAGNHYIALIGLGLMLASGFGDRTSRPVALAAAAACAAWTVLAWIEVGRWQSSTSVFQHAIEVSSSNALAYERLGAALRDQGHLAESIPNFEAAAKLRAGDAFVHENFAQALAQSGRMEEAIAQLGKAPLAHVTRGDVFLRAERAEKAEAEFGTALAIDKDDLRARFGLGCALAAQSRMADATPLLQDSLQFLTDEVRLKPDQGEANYNLARAYDLLGRKDDAMVELSAAVRLQPDDPAPHLALGVAFHERGRTPDAFDHIATAVRLQPHNPRALFLLAQVLSETGRPKEALSRLVELLKLRPDYPGARDAHDLMHQRVYGN
jgi:tetratricopeptide (TPR) repeat protein